MVKYRFETLPGPVSQTIAVDDNHCVQYVPCDDPAMAHAQCNPAERNSNLGHRPPAGRDAQRTWNGVTPLLSDRMCATVGRATAK